MPDLTTDQETLLAERVAHVLDRARESIAQIDQEARVMLAELDGYKDDEPLITNAARLFVAEFDAKDDMRYRRGSRATLGLPGTIWNEGWGGDHIVLQEYHGDGVLLQPGRYRAVVALIPIPTKASSA